MELLGFDIADRIALGNLNVCGIFVVSTATQLLLLLLLSCFCVCGASVSVSSV